MINVNRFVPGQMCWFVVQTDVGNHHCSEFWVSCGRCSAAR